ncbi:protein phosphatase 1 regulatory subunit 3C [Bombina bombina]|uniref:protein phosphatase 1 regulatory subunit 3C n=1 Tax=Bombina bombina TaxID=8345 RepID=UPI00235AD4F0|nr:protein phosphatase 1 regulatory subunit 3C [Bombina bombina]
MPGDFSMCLILSPPTPHHLRLSTSAILRPCLSPTPRPPDPRKKAVVFADALGLALTSVRHFVRQPFEDDSLMLTLASLRVLRPLSSPTYILDFPPPAMDYLQFRTKLMDKFVSLEQCAVQGEAVAGTVRVRNIGFEKSVTLRVTFDNWQIYNDLPCCYMRDLHSGGETDSFSFRLVLPLGTEQAEFCIRFWCEGKEYWDSNDGCNYSLHKKAEHGGFRQRPYW